MRGVLREFTVYWDDTGRVGGGSACGGARGADTASGWVVGMARKAKKKKVAKKAGVSRAPPSKGSRKKAAKAKKTPAQVEAGYRAVVKSSGFAQVVALSNDGVVVDVPGRISTRSLVLDRLLRTERLDGSFEAEGGFPQGRVVEITGPEWVGKTTLLDLVLASAQAMGGAAILHDTEIARDKPYMTKLGVDLAKLHYHTYKPHALTVERVMSISIDGIRYYRDQAPDMPVALGFDALGGTKTEDEAKKPLYDESVKKKRPRPGSAASAMARVMRHIPGELQGSRVCLVIVNHEYQSFQMSKSGRSIRKPYGGSALPYAAHVRISLFPTGDKIEDANGFVIGKWVHIRFSKSRHMLAGESEDRIAIVTGRGVDNLRSVHAELVRAGVMVLNGGWYVLNLNGKEEAFHGYWALERRCFEDSEFYGMLVSLYKEVTGWTT